jgi:hypothetical protein
MVARVQLYHGKKKSEIGLLQTVYEEQKENDKFGLCAEITFFVLFIFILVCYEMFCFIKSDMHHFT